LYGMQSAFEMVLYSYYVYSRIYSRIILYSYFYLFQDIF
jgi:hypothetical protein